MARAQHEPHSGGSLCLGTSGETGQPQAIILTFPLPREKVKEHTNMSGRRSARLKAAAAKAPPAAKPAPKRTAKHKLPKSNGVADDETGRLHYFGGLARRGRRSDELGRRFRP